MILVTLESREEAIIITGMITGHQSDASLSSSLQVCLTLSVSWRELTEELGWGRAAPAAAQCSGDW